MDFITLANTAHEASRTVYRLLAKVEGTTTSEDDDFANLENIHTQHDVVLDTAAVGGGAYTNTNQIPQMENRPLFSPTAESALLELSTNFLLYVAMVMITTFVAKIYFPSWLEPREEPTQAHSSHNNHKYMNVMRHMSDDFSDEEDEDEDFEEEGADEDFEAGRFRDNVNGSSNSTSNHINNEEEQQQEGAGLLFKGSEKQHPPPKRMSKSASSSFLFDLNDQETKTKNSVYTNLALCAIMLNVTFVSWGLLQERMLTRRYPRLTGEYFSYSYALVFTNRFWTLIMSGMLLIYFKPRTSRSTIIYEYSFPSISNMLSSWCQYEALRYVSFPAVTLFKSFKLAPVMIMGKLLGNHSCK